MSKKVLVVDDDPDVRSFVLTVLDENRYIPLVAQDGVEGFEMIEKDPPDLVILDVLMPRGSGIRLYHKMKTSDKYKRIPIIMFTGIALKSFLKSQKVLDEFKGMEVPEPEIYLEKPVDPEELAAAVKKQIG
ncbi:MAG: response regulator [Desulfobacteraceae bacterium]|nr:MAG: response regulator [Desulfobacteraceae bacterium]